jgi:hypothetical protein
MYRIYIIHVFARVKVGENFIEEIYEPELRTYRRRSRRFDEEYNLAVQTPYRTELLEEAIRTGLIALKKLNALRKIADNVNYRQDEVTAIREKVDQLRKIRTDPHTPLFRGPADQVEKAV